MTVKITEKVKRIRAFDGVRFAKTTEESLDKIIRLSKEDPERIIPILKEGFRQLRPISLNGAGDQIYRLFTVYNKTSVMHQEKWTKGIDLT